ncbi:hypothetical protein HNP50_000630 [Elizabethkingia anophelis]|nr:hypothetical protein [Elizabethkingia anophelis]MCW2466258.1 hypothetical protein [Elizabethkingia anophelis]MCW2469942.1 hypothetical protein [Elizabethkingia anophelis]
MSETCKGAFQGDNRIEFAVFFYQNPVRIGANL